MQDNVYIALGSNLGDRLTHLQFGVNQLGYHPQIDVVALSPIYESEAHTFTPDEEQPHYLNAVIQIQTTLLPLSLLEVCKSIEKAGGRKPDRWEWPWQARTLDLDLVLYGSLRMATPRLTIPHAHMTKRRFVLQPLADMAPDFIVPLENPVRVDTLLQACTDTKSLERVSYHLSLPHA